QARFDRFANGVVKTGTSIDTDHFPALVCHMCNLCPMTSCIDVTGDWIIYPFKHLLARRALALQRKVEIVDQGTWDTAAAGGTLMVRAGTQDQVALAGKPQEAVAEHTVDGFVEAHDVERGLNNAVLDPEGGKTGHASYAASRAIRIVQVPDIVNVNPSIEA